MREEESCWERRGGEESVKGGTAEVFVLLSAEARERSLSVWKFRWARKGPELKRRQERKRQRGETV